MKLMLPNQSQLLTIDSFISPFSKSRNEKLSLDRLDPAIYCVFCLETTFSIFEGRISDETVQHRQRAHRVCDLLAASDDLSRLRQGGLGEGCQQLDRSQYNKKLDLLLGALRKAFFISRLKNQTTLFQLIKNVHVSFLLFKNIVSNYCITNLGNSLVE